ncbi:MAG: hypothetical protein AAGJ46_11255 [Planctomycetota bacterium]
MCLLAVGLLGTPAPLLAQLTFSNLGQTNPSGAFLSNPAPSTFTTIFEGNGTSGDASDGRGQGFLTPAAGSGNNAWALSGITVFSNGTGMANFPASDRTFQLSVYQWPTSNPADAPSVSGGQLDGTLLYQETVTLTGVPSFNDRLLFDLGTDVFLNENEAYGFLIEFDPASGAKNSEQFRLRVSGNNGGSFNPGSLWRTEFNTGAGAYQATSNFTSQDLGFFLVGDAIADPLAPTLLVDRATGRLTLDAQTQSPLEIISYEITTESGGFDQAAWATIESQGLDADDQWFRFSSPTSTTDLAEGTLGELALVGGAAVIDFGQAWVPSPFEDLELVVQLADGQDIAADVQYTGMPITMGDYTGPAGLPDGVIDEMDWPVVRDNMLRDVSMLGAFGRYQAGDMNGDGVVDRFDFRDFKLAFESANGQGSFARMLAGVPEPTAVAITAVAGMALLLRRRALPIVLLLFCAFLGGQRTSAQVIFTETWNTGNGTPGDWVSFSSFSENRSEMTGQEGDRSRALNNPTSTGPGYAYNNLTASQGLTWQPDTRYTIDLLVGYRAPGFSGALDFGLWDGVPASPGVQPSLGIEGFVDVANGDGDPNPVVPANQFVEVASLDDPSVVQFSFDTGEAAPTDDLVVFLRNTATDPRNNERVYTDFLRVNTESLGDLLSLVVDPVSGVMQLRGSTTSVKTIDYFQVESASGRLLTANWNSLDDQGVGDNGAIPGWEEAGQSGPFALAEQFLRGGYDTALNAAIGQPLGQLFNTSGGVDPTEDLSFLYTLADGTDVQGRVLVETIAAADPPGDYNDDGVVNAADFTIWRDSLGQSVTLPNDSTPGAVDAGDYAVWRVNFGQSAASAAAATPEPGGVAVLAVSVWTLASRRRRADTVAGVSPE